MRPKSKSSECRMFRTFLTEGRTCWNLWSKIILGLFEEEQRGQCGENGGNKRNSDKRWADREGRSQGGLICHEKGGWIYSKLDGKSVDMFELKNDKTWWMLPGEQIIDQLGGYWYAPRQWVVMIWARVARLKAVKINWIWWGFFWKWKSLSHVWLFATPRTCPLNSPG